MNKVHHASPTFIHIGERVQQLDMLLHVQQFSSLVVLLSGESNTGKSSLLSVAKDRLAAHSLVFYFDALEHSDEQSIIVFLASQLKCAATLAAIEQTTQDTNLHVLVDDAHLLDAPALTLLVALSGKQESWHLVLCGDTAMQVKLTELQQELQAEKLYHQIDLQPLSEAELSQFISELFKQAGVNEQPLSEQKIHQLWLLSNGLPGKLIELLDIEKEQQQRLSARFPLGHVAAIVLIGVALVFSFLYQEEAQVAAPQDVIALLLEQKSLQSPQETPNDGLEKIAKASAVDSQALVGQKLNINEQLTLPKSSDSDNTPQITATELKVKTPQARQSLAINKKASQAISAKSKQPQSHPLLTASPNEYVLQLLGVRSEKSAKAFMTRFERELNGDKLSVYQTKYKGQPWFVVVYGPFNNKNSANSEASSLGRKLKSRPWIRPVSKIQEDIRQFIIP
ncbi:hypothetical protein A9Q73_06605 [Bermanella sp. 47_1433_sub80_T6]|nr:hypothetical protein A9Q73_06605 [Bermanella sp. 47_1433_sub80_T6]